MPKAKPELMKHLPFAGIWYTVETVLCFAELPYFQVFFRFFIPWLTQKFEVESNYNIQKMMKPKIRSYTQNHPSGDTSRHDLKAADMTANSVLSKEINAFKKLDDADQSKFSLSMHSEKQMLLDQSNDDELDKQSIDKSESDNILKKSVTSVGERDKEVTG